MSKKLKFFLMFFFIFLLLIFFSKNYLLNKMVSFLVVQDKLEKSDVIIVLSGDTKGERVGEGILLFKQGYASQLLFSGGPLAWRLTQADNMLRQALFYGVPKSKILLEKQSRSTFENAKFSLELLRNKKIQSLIIVTSPPHTRRSKLVFQKIFKDLKVKIMVYPVQKSEFKKEKWWQDHEDTQFVVQEYLSLFFYWFKRYL